MAASRATTIRFSEAMYDRLEEAAEQTGLTINAITVVACLEWLDQHQARQAAMPRVGWGPLAPEVPSGPPWRGLFSGRRGSSGRGHFDRFTGRARTVMTIAAEEAASAGRPISPEFLLLALALEGQGLGARALIEAGPSTDDLRVRATSAGAAFGTAGQPTADLKRTIEAAFDEANLRGHAHVGTEHLLLGLLRDQRFSEIAGPVRAALDRVMADASRGGEAGRGPR